ncbi:carbohydrate-binding protein [Streptomyces mirabilis]|uniref:hypothetical protein n=1 Tax=Streptomyces mirabilis TaxID=68239 RepID=UPI00368E1C11
MLTLPRPRRGIRRAGRRLAVAAVAAVGAMCVSVLPAAATQGAPPSKALRAGPTSPAPRQAQAAASAAVGATTPFSVYEAEAGTPGGGAAVRSLTSAPTTQYSNAALEAPGHSCVHLDGTGQSVRWTNTTGQGLLGRVGHLTYRFSVPVTPPPDAESGMLARTLRKEIGSTGCSGRR